MAWHRLYSLLLTMMGVVVVVAVFTVFWIWFFTSGARVVFEIWGPQ